MHHEYLRWPAVHQATQLSRSTAWRLERDGQFPCRRQLSANAVGWLRAEVEDWVKNRGVVRTAIATAAATSNATTMEG